MIPARNRGHTAGGWKLRGALAALLLLMSTVGSYAEAAEEERAEAIRLDLQEPPALANGSVALVEGEVDAEGLEFILPDLSILQPVEVRVMADDAARPVRIEVTKFGHDGILKQATTRPGEDAVLQFRTQLGVGLTVRAICSAATTSKAATRRSTSSTSSPRPRDPG